MGPRRAPTVLPLDQIQVSVSFSPLELVLACSVFTLMCFNGLSVLQGVDAHKSVFADKDFSVLTENPENELKGRKGI